MFKNLFGSLKVIVVLVVVVVAVLVAGAAL